MPVPAVRQNLPSETLLAAFLLRQMQSRRLARAPSGELRAAAVQRLAAIIDDLWARVPQRRILAGEEAHDRAGIPDKFRNQLAHLLLTVGVFDSRHSAGG